MQFSQVAERGECQQGNQGHIILSSDNGITKFRFSVCSALSIFVRMLGETTSPQLKMAGVVAQAASGILIGLAIVGIALWSKSTASTVPSPAQTMSLEQPRVSAASDELPATAPAGFAQRRVCNGEHAIACRRSDNAYWLYRLDR
jgi:hypothetical protein